MLLGEEWRDNAWGSSREWLIHFYHIHGYVILACWLLRVMPSVCRKSCSVNAFKSFISCHYIWLWLISFRSFSVSTNHGAAATRPRFPREWWCEFCAFTSLRRWRPWSKHGGVRPELLSRWQDGRSLQERRLCKSTPSQSLLHFIAKFEWWSYLIFLFMNTGWRRCWPRWEGEEWCTRKGVALRRR